MKILILIIILCCLLLIGILIYKILNKPSTPKNKQPSGPPSDFKADDGMPSSCKDKTSFQTTAKNKLPILVKNFIKCATEQPFNCVRANEILKVRDALKVFSFAYFPLKSDSSKPNGKITYIQSSCVKNTNTNNNINTSINTDDPVEVLLYYSSSIYTFIGSVEDASASGNTNLQQCLTKTLNDLKLHASSIFSNNIIQGLSWQDYFENPGPNGSTTGSKKVDWAIDKPTNSKSPNTSLMLDKKVLKKRDTGGQFWGDVIPKQDSDTVSSIGELIKTQTNETKKRYKKLLNISKDDGKWSDVITDNSDNIDIYHKFRKSIRTLGRTLEAYSFEIPAMFVKLPDQFKQKIKSSFNVVLNSTYYKEALCLGSYNLLTQKCSPEKIIGFLLFVDDRNEFPPSLWGLSEDDYNTLRAMILMYTLKIGTEKSYPLNYLDKSVVYCPSNMPNNYPTSKKGIFTNFDSIKPYMWSAPSLTNNLLYGTFCEIDDIMGDLHDVMVYYQQNMTNKRIATQSMINYIKNSSLSLENFFNQIDINSIMDSISKNVCS